MPHTDRTDVPSLLFALRARAAMRYDAHHGELCDVLAQPIVRHARSPPGFPEWATIVTYMCAVLALTL